MKEKISRVLRSTTGFIFVTVALIVTILLHIWVLSANYGGILQSLELLGYDQKPLGDDRLFGWLFEAFGFGNATLCEFYAGALVIAMSISLVGVCYFITQLIIRIRDRAIFLKTGDNESVANINVDIIYNILPWLFIFILLCSIVTLWDIKLFNLRAFGGLMGAELPETILSLTHSEILKYKDSFAIEVTKFSSFGYVAAVVVTIIISEYLFMKFKERWELLYDAYGNLFSSEESDLPQTVSPPEEETDVSREESNNLATPQENVDEEVEIIGGDGNRIRRSQALKNKGLFIDNEGRVWDKKYYNRVVKEVA